MVAKTKGYEAIQYLTSTDFQKSKWSKEQHEIYKSAIREFQLAPQIDVDVSERQLLKVLEGHINPKKVIKKLRNLKEKFGDKNAKRLSRK